MSLLSANSYASLVGVPARQCSDGRVRVAPGDPRASYLMDKLLGVNLCFGTKMPKTTMGLPTADIEKITAWICNGAMND